MPLRICLEGGHLFQGEGPRCPGHTRAKDRATLRLKRKLRPHTYAEDVRRAEVVFSWRALYGDLCPGWRRDAHPATPTNPLTADHPHAVARGGDEHQSLSVLCRQCNSRKRDHIM